MEQIDLTAPVTPPTQTYWRVRQILLDRGNGTAALPARVAITLVGTNSELLLYAYEGATAVTMLNTLNTANLATKSLERRVLERLIADGVIAGAISGTPN